MRRYLLNLLIFFFMLPLSMYGCNASHGGDINDSIEHPSNDSPGSGLSKVYMIKEINPENLVKIYEALGRTAKGKVAVKLSTGEPGGNNYLKPTLIKDLVQKVNGTIVECNTAFLSIVIAIRIRLPPGWVISAFLLRLTRWHSTRLVPIWCGHRKTTEKYI